MDAMKTQPHDINTAVAAAAAAAAITKYDLI